MAGYLKMSAFKRKNSLDGKEDIIGLSDAQNVKFSLESLIAYLVISKQLGFGGVIEPDSPAVPSSEGDLFWFGTVEGTYTNFGGLTLPANNIGIFIRKAGVYSLATLEITPQDLTPYVKKTDVGKNSLDYSPYILDNTVITTAGTIGTNPTQYAGAKSIVNMPIPLGDWTLGGYVVNTGKNFALANAEGDIKEGSIKTLGNSSITFTVEDDGYNLLRVFFKSFSEPNDNGWINTMTLVSGNQYQQPSVNSILGLPIFAQGLTAGNRVPDPIDDINAVNFGYLKTNSILISDLTVTKSPNLAKQRLNIDVIPNKYIGNTGSIATGQYWVMYKFKPLEHGLKAGDPLTIGGFTISTAGYAAWYEGNTLKTYLGSYGNHNLPKTYVVPEDATENTILYFDIARPTDINSYEFLVINEGTELLPYVNPYGTITEIKGYNIAGGGNSNVSSFFDLIDVPKGLINANKALKYNSTADGLETFTVVENGQDVNFNRVDANVLSANITDMSDVPVWDETGTAPIPVNYEYLYPDGSGNYFRKVRGV